MTKVTECSKICLKADAGKMLYNAGIEIYTPKAYLFAETEESEWKEVDASAVPAEEEITDTEALEILLGGGV